MKGEVNVVSVPFLFFATIYNHQRLVQHVLHDVRSHFKSFDVLNHCGWKGACD